MPGHFWITDSAVRAIVISQQTTFSPKSRNLTKTPLMAPEKMQRLLP